MIYLIHCMAISESDRALLPSVFTHTQRIRLDDRSTCLVSKDIVRHTYTLTLVLQ